MSPFTRLATVELQLVMHFCDQRTLIALARCSRAALAAASQPFAWRSLSPLSLSCSSPLELSARMADSLPRHAQIAVEWTIPAPADVVGAQEQTDSREGDDDAVMAAEIAALVSLPRLRELSVIPHRQSPDSHLAQLVTALRERVEHGGALMSLALRLRDPHITERVFVALAALLVRSRMLTALKVNSCEVDTAMVRALAAGLQNNESLATLHLTGCAFGDDGAIALAAALAHSRSLTDLQLDYCWIGDAGAVALAAACQQRGSIRVLNLSDNSSIGAVGAAALASLLAADRCAVETLDLSHCCIGDDGATALAKSLQANRSLTALRLEHCRIEVEGTAALTAALRRSDHCSLRVLDLSYNTIDATGAASLADFLRTNSTLEQLDLNQCGLSDAGVAALAAGLPHTQSLRELRLRCNLSAAGAPALAAGIGRCSSLTLMDLTDNFALRDAGFASLAPSLRGLESLDAQDCGLTSASGPTLAALVQHAPRLGALVLSFNAIGTAGVTALAAALQPTTGLRTLYLDACDVDAEGAAALAAALARGWPATDLSIGRNAKIGDDGARALAAALDQCADRGRSALTGLGLNVCELSIAGALALVRAAVRIPTLRTLSLTCILYMAITDLDVANKAEIVAKCAGRPRLRLML